MSDLEQEFKKLVDGLYKEISKKEVDGDLSFEEARQLRDMVYYRVSNVQGREDDSWCSSGNYDDDYWQSSSQSC